jgi:hypothetical protein
MFFQAISEKMIDPMPLSEDKRPHEAFILQYSSVEIGGKSTFKHIMYNQLYREFRYM